MALVLVMCLLVLLSVLFMAYFSTITAERTSARNFAASSETRQLVESALAIVMAQITDATTRQPGTTWTSQPGLIRTFDDTGRETAAYKLYSSDKMLVKGGFNVRASVDQEVPKDWAQRTGEFIDVNAPSRRYAFGRRYPIVDPDAVKQVGGFQVDPKNGVAMPVRWLYVLQNGQFATGRFLSKGQVKVERASAENPVVGRIAFWTDDETCKVNLNTASEGVFWDMPRTQSQEDLDYAAKQPAALEFQRFPGHPATVCLSEVFPDLVERASPHYSKIYDLAPRVAGGGSAEGTIDVVTNRSFTSVGTVTDRLFASVDELLYTQTHAANADLSAEQVERARFFVTVNSRSPELNLFNLPRVTLWPIPVDPALRNEKADPLMALCSTLPGASNAKFYFTRRNAGHASVDFAADANNAALYQYLQRLTSLPVPGFGGGTLEQKYGAAERDQILTEIYDYARCLNTLDGTQSSAAKCYTANNPGQVVPIQIGNTRGFGRFPTISEAAIRFYTTETASGKVTKIKAALLLATSVPAQGYPGIQPDCVVSVTTSASPLKVNGAPIEFTGDLTLSATVSSFASPLGGEEGLERTCGGGRSYTSNPIAVTDGKFTFDGGSVSVTIWNKGRSSILQTLTVSFPAVTATLSAPQIPPSDWTWDYRKLDAFKYDVVRSVGALKGDARLVAGRSTVPPSVFAPADLAVYQSDKPLVFGLRRGQGGFYDGAQGVDPVASGGDWDNGVGSLPDGAYIGKPDEGCAVNDATGRAYFNRYTLSLSSKYYFTQQQLASPVALGSLPTGVMQEKPWQTLLFCPNPVAASHPGLSSPPDFLWLDLFTVPTVEPYAISEPLTANGRVNLNCEMVPFTGLVRQTALRAAMKSIRVLAIPTTDSAIYKSGTPAPVSYRHEIDLDETLKQWEQRFAKGEVFRSPAEICSLFLVPKGATESAMPTWWQGYGLTGDNSREMPYNHLYPLLTTQSNAFTVHYRAQTLVKAVGSAPDIWEEGRDVVVAESRGASLIERRLDPNDARLKTVNVLSQSLTPYYRFRVVSTAAFVP